MILGHEKIVRFFDEAVDNGSIAQSYCLVGPAQVGKRTVARQVVARLLSTTVERLFSHPDFYYLERRIDPKTGKLPKDVSVAQARELKERWRGRPWQGGYQVAIIDEAERLNDESANALLKLLEEPPAKSVIFLLTENGEGLLPTIRSRCQLFYCSPIPERIIHEGLLALGYSEPLVQKATALAWGRPGRALTWLQDENFQARCQEGEERWQQLRNRSVAEKEKLLENIFATPDDSGARREDLREMLEMWQMQWRTELVSHFNTGTQIRKQTAAAPRLAELIAILERLQITRQLLEQNVHPRLLVEQAVLLF